MQGARPRAYSRRTSQGAQRRRRPQAAATQWSCWLTTGPAGAPGGWAPIPSLLVVDYRREIAFRLAPRTRGPSPGRASTRVSQYPAGRRSFMPRRGVPTMRATRHFVFPLAATAVLVLGLLAASTVGAAAAAEPRTVKIE